MTGQDIQADIDGQIGQCILVRQLIHLSIMQKYQYIQLSWLMEIVKY